MQTGEGTYTKSVHVFEHWEMDVLSTPEREQEIIEIPSPLVDLPVNH